MTAPGGPEVLRLVELPEPEITGEHDVKVRLRAAGINPADYKQRANGAIGGSLPVVLGADGAGIVESTGPGVTRFRAGGEGYFCGGGLGGPWHDQGGRDRRRAVPRAQAAATVVRRGGRRTAGHDHRLGGAAGARP